MLERVTSFAMPTRVLVSLLALAVGGFFLFSLGPYPQLTSLNENQPLPEEQFSSPESTAEFLGRIGPAGRDLYSQFQLLDLLNPILMCTFLILLMAWLIKLSLLTKQLKYLCSFPLVIVIAEVWENSLLYLAANSYPAMPVGMETHAIALYIKFGGLLLSKISVFVLACIVFFKKVSRVPASHSKRQ